MCTAGLVCYSRHMSSHPPFPDALVRFARSPHADVRTFAFKWLARLASSRASEALATVTEEPEGDERDAVLDLVAAVNRAGPVELPARLASSLRDREPSLAKLVEATRRVRAAGADAWALVADAPAADFEDTDDDFDEPVAPELTAFGLAAGADPRAFFDSLRVLLDEGQASSVPVAAVRRLAGCARPDDVATLVRWADATGTERGDGGEAREPKAEERWEAIEPVVRAVGTVEEAAHLAYDTEDDMRGQLEADIPGTRAERVLTREVLSSLRRIDGDRAAVRRDVAARLGEAGPPIEGPLADAAACGEAILRALAGSSTRAWTATNILLEVAIALGRVEMLARMMRESAPLAGFVAQLRNLSPPVDRIVQRQILEAWVVSTQADRASAVDAIVRWLVAAGEDLPYASAHLAAELPDFPLERVLGEAWSKIDSDVAHELAAGVAHHLECHGRAQPAAWSHGAVEAVLDHLVDSPCEAAPAFLLEHWDALVAAGSLDDAVACARGLGDARLLPRLTDEWRPGEPSVASAARLVARLAGTEHGLPPPLLADAAACEDEPVPNGELVLRLTCRGCRRAFWYDLNEAWVEDTNDGLAVVAGRVVRCKRCGVVDDFDLRDLDWTSLVAPSLASRSARARIHPGLPRLDDGTLVTSASQALAVSRRRVEEDPSVASWRQLAKVALQFRENSTVVEASERVLELDPRDVSTAVNLGLASVSVQDAAKARVASARALAIFVAQRARFSDGDRSSIASHVVGPLIYAALEGHATALRLTWKFGSATRTGGLDLARVTTDRYAQVAALLASDALVAAEVVGSLTGDEAAVLDEYLAARTRVAASRTPPARNAPCPCGSGAKYKKCCRR